MSNELIEQVREARASLAEEHGNDIHKLQEWAIEATKAYRNKQRPNKRVDSNQIPRTESAEVASFDE